MRTLNENEIESVSGGDRGDAAVAGAIAGGALGAKLGSVAGPAGAVLGGISGGIAGMLGAIFVYNIGCYKHC